jgi:hypothetical protein
MSDSTVGQTKKFGKGERTVPHPSQKASKWYPVDDESQPKKVSTMQREERNLPQFRAKNFYHMRWFERLVFGA